EPLSMADDVRTVGIIGGIGPESTIIYYRSIVDAYRARKKDDRSSPSIIINSIDMQALVALFGVNDTAAVAQVLLAEIQTLAAAGAGFAVIAANTPHMVFDALRQRSPIPLISIVEATRDAAVELHLSRLALLGTRFTMQARFFPDVFDAAGIALILPSPAEQDFIHDKYMNELVPGIILDETKERLLAIVRRMRADDAIDGVILGGTELPLILGDVREEGIPFLDTTQIHVARIVARLLQ
ncbi:MAG: amino acid racemase, partial [Gemmatimonadota bacterium]|nr:amino acid racemase [Gemmatimonadota bacterium]